MKVGYFVGYVEENGEGKIVTSEHEMMLEEFMEKFKIDDPQNVVGPFMSPDGMAKMKESLVRLALVKIHGSSDPKKVSAARNTNLFKMKGPLMGDLGGKLGITLMKFVADLTGREAKNG